MRMLLTKAAIGGLAIATVSTAAIADQRLEQVRVEASRIVTTDAGKTFAGFPVKNINLSYEVSLDDLDLMTSDGVSTAEKRINNAAAAACKEIGTKAPDSTPADAQCAKTTARKPLAQLHQAIAAAKTGSAK